MNYCEIKPVDIANGTGVRVSLFVSGCTHHCKGCFNAVTWDFNYGNMFTSEVENNIIELLKPNFIEGLTLLGGEPFEPQNQVVLVKFLNDFDFVCDSFMASSTLSTFQLVSLGIYDTSFAKYVDAYAVLHIQIIAVIITKNTLDFITLFIISLPYQNYNITPYTSAIIKKTYN